MRAALAISACAVLAACSQGGQDAGETADDFAERAGVAGARPEQPSVAEINAQPVIAPTGMARLSPLGPAAPAALGEIAESCSFVYQGRSLLVAGAPAGADTGAKGVAVIDGRQLVLPGSEAGGPAYVEGGPTFVGDGYTVAVLRAEGAPHRAGERSEWPADLIVAGPTPPETRFSPGTWSCPA